MDGMLILQDGTRYQGRGFGGRGTAVEEVVFQTAMTGYEEILTDPSYQGQIVTMTCPHIGNTGINGEDGESDAPRVKGLIVREICRIPSSYRSRVSLDEYMRRHGICGLSDIDTRALTRRIRDKGAMMGILSTEGLSPGLLEEKLRTHEAVEKLDLVRQVTLDERQRPWTDQADAEWREEDFSSLKKARTVAVLDFGVKHQIPRLMTSLGWRVIRYSADAPPEALLECRPDGVFLSNGPGNPGILTQAVQTVRSLVERCPLFGICLGHQILALALGADTFKLKFGHHGANHPVLDLSSGRVAITSQNHNYAVDPVSLKRAGLESTQISLNDGTVEGMRHQDLPVLSVQYHPEAAPGPHDAANVFQRFDRLMETR
ncbi:MAG TPA: carbamoyl-phosphate synthase small subunit [bacterium]|nr:carbamoyl-phosphate synthase small subunit [bacterium]